MPSVLYRKMKTVVVLATILLLVKVVLLRLDGWTMTKTEQIDTSFKPLNSCNETPASVWNISCARIIQGDIEYMKSIHLSPQRKTQTCDVPTVCDSVIVKSITRPLPVTQEELDFPLAFTLKVHKDFLQIAQLLRAIYRPHNVYCIHIDTKADTIMSRRMKELAACLSNVIVLQEIKVVYASIGLLMSDIVCMKRHVKSEVKWRYYLNLAGQEFPLKTNLEIVQILKTLKGRNDIESYKFPSYLYQRFLVKYEIFNNILIKRDDKVKEPFKHNITFYKGSMYGAFTRSFVNFLLTNQISKDLIAWAADTFAPEELVWSTIKSIGGAPGGYNITAAHGKREVLSRAVIWSPEKPCFGKFVRTVCVFSYKDLPWLTSAPELIANKFHSDYDQIVLDCLDEWLYNKTMLGVSVNMNWNFYRNMPHSPNRP